MVRYSFFILTLKVLKLRQAKEFIDRSVVNCRLGVATTVLFHGEMEGIVPSFAGLSGNENDGINSLVEDHFRHRIYTTTGGS